MNLSRRSALVRTQSHSQLWQNHHKRDNATKAHQTESVLQTGRAAQLQCTLHRNCKGRSHAKPPFQVLRVLDTGPITNHVNFVRTPRGQFAYVTIGGLNQVKAFRTSDFQEVGNHPGRRFAARHLAVR